MQSLVTASHFYATVFFIVFLVWMLPEWIGTYLQRSEHGARRRDRGSHAVIVFGLGIAGIGAAWCVANVPAATMARAQPVVFWIGIAAVLGGVAFRWYAIRVLGRFFTRDVATRAGQTVVERGPYRLLRHPSYSGALLSIAGFGLTLTNWLALAVLIAGAFLAYTYRVHVEERALCDALGEPYRDYMKRTRRFIPYVW